jgi:hypothetical protein
MVNGNEMTAPGIILSKTEMFETSFVPLGRDRNTSSVLFSEDFELKLQPQEEQQMENEEQGTEEKVNVPVAEMRAAFANDPEFALDAIERGLSVLEAKAEYCDKLEAVNAELTETIDELQAAMDDAGDVDGEEPVEYFEEQPAEVFEKDSPEAQIEELRKNAMNDLGLNSSDALRHVLKQNPELADKLI